MNPDVTSVNAMAWGANGPSYGSVAIAGPMRGAGSVEEGDGVTGGPDDAAGDGLLEGPDVLAAGADGAGDPQATRATPRASPGTTRISRLRSAGGRCATVMCLPD